MKKNFRNSRKAIAPAIAVALLLAITIALVAAVGYAASNVTPSAETAPQGVFEVEISKTGGGMGGGEVAIRQYSGDAIDTQNLKLKFVCKGVATEVFGNGNNTFYMRWNLYNPLAAEGAAHDTDGDGVLEDPVEADQTTVGVQFCTESVSDGTWIGDIQSVALFDGAAWVDVPESQTHPTIEYVDPWSGTTLLYRNFTIYNNSSDPVIYTKVKITNDYGVTAEYDVSDPSDLHDGDLTAGNGIFARMQEFNSPYRYSVAWSPEADTEVHFGNFVLVPGETMKAHAGTGRGVTPLQALMSNWDYIISGDVVEVYFIYSPTNQVIWQGDVVVE